MKNSRTKKKYEHLNQSPDTRVAWTGILPNIIPTKAFTTQKSRANQQKQLAKKFTATAPDFSHGYFV